jgi:uncharacterized membrane protein (UPF0127 family)
MHKVSNKIILLIFLLLLFGNSCNQKATPPYSTLMEVGDKKIFVETVSTLEKMQQGLSGREKLENDRGMLFDFSGQTDRRPGFWMKDMKFDLDFIWIKNKKIIGITPNVPSPKSVDDKLQSYYPPSDVDMVLEVNTGWSEKYKIKIGDEIRLK